MKKLLVFSVVLCAWGVASGAFGQETTPTPKEYRDARGKVVSLPLGDLSFADRVVRFEVGNPSARQPEYRNPELALGPPNYIRPGSPDFTPLGCGGTLVLNLSTMLSSMDRGQISTSLKSDPRLNPRNWPSRRMVSVGWRLGGFLAAPLPSISRNLSSPVPHFAL
jgi:hypothetical protein